VSKINIGPPGDADHARSSDAELAAHLVTEAGRLAVRMRSDGLTVARKTSIIDPVDGTFNFVSGLPAWCSAIALLDGQTTLLGAVYQATTEELWVGGLDHPTTLNGQPLPRLVDRPLADVAISTYLHPTRVTDIELRDGLLRSIAAAASVRIIGSGSVELAAVAAGRLGVWLHADTLSWDWLPGAALVEHAGGHIEVFEHGGHRWHLAGPPTAVAQARETVLGG
jgi:myo-inositol-1(or 4)-monophosphatase